MYSVRRHLGWLVLIVLSLIPVALWADVRPLASRFLNATTTLTSIGQLTGLIGMSLFAVVLILSGRFRWIEPFFGGIDRLYRVHHLAGGISLLLLLVHPLSLAATSVFSSTRSVALLLLPGTDLAVNLGIASLLLLVAMIAITLYMSLRYGTWKRAHQYLGLSFFLAGLHTLLIQSDVSRSLPLRVYLLSLTGIALLVFLYRTILGRFLVRRFRYTIDRIDRLSERVIEVVLRPNGELLRSLPGQYVFVRFESPALTTESHPFTVSSAADDPTLRITIHALGDDTTSMLSHLTAGATATIEGPFGQLTNLGDYEQVWVAGGAGIAPFLSMARSLDTRDATHPITLFYCTRTVQDAVFLSELQEISARHPRMRIIPHHSATQQHLVASAIRDEVGGLEGKHVSLCGSPGMVHDLTGQFRAFGLPRSSLHTEGFSLLPEHTTGVKRAVATALTVSSLAAGGIITNGLASSTMTHPAPRAGEGTDTTQQTAEALTLELLATHSQPSDCWLLIDGKIYDVTQYIAQQLHPGENATIAPYCGTDATQAYDTKARRRPKDHSAQADRDLSEYYIGDLAQ